MKNACFKKIGTSSFKVPTQILKFIGCKFEQTNSFKNRKSLLRNKQELT